MKEGVFYILFLLFIMIFAVSEQGANKNTHNDISTCQSIDVSKDINCIIFQIKFSLKKTFPIVNNFRLEDKNLCRKDDNHKVILTLKCLRLQHLTTIDLKPIILRPYRLRLYHSPKNQDEHHLT